MYLAQAARQFEYWTGEKAPIAKMRRSALDELEAMRQDAERRAERH
jgi:shikimate 5-dehydrogenase